MGTFPYKYQEEIHAIETCTNEINNECLRGVNVFILSDSQAASKAVKAYKF